MTLPTPTTPLQIIAVRVWEASLHNSCVLVSLVGLNAADQFALITFQRDLVRWRLETVWS